MGATGLRCSGNGFLTRTLPRGVFPLDPGRTRLLYDLAGVGVQALLYAFFAFSIVSSILRYRLWDIDSLISRALVYGSLTVVLGASYLLTVVVLQAAVRAVTGQESNLVIVVSTLMIAGAFQPLRARLQAIIDRRFYSRKYDAARTLAAFSATARDEVDQDRLSRALVGVVAETMQPAHVSLWLREREDLNPAPNAARPHDRG